ncbi:RNA demethylase ALKBH9B-like [Juglans microcarpa x Juglans regia]|uniref:RNA demethylase ALKBH9B-like n=1 Tax=Juglans microcarpa x Juglans regia TaxID=2249226 RepID=UPI001B7E5009|nr:RNA demethylase ALKBH9B-like [Juglans microcarpa x Juglans regia]
MAKHCVPPVPTARISITFRRMDDSKRPIGYVTEPDLQDIQQLPYVVDRRNYRLNNCPRPEYYSMMTWRGCSEERRTSRKPRSSSCQSCRRNSLSRSRKPPYRNRSRGL